MKIIFVNNYINFCLHKIMLNDIILGIDLGTTNSVASYWNGKKCIYIKNNNSNIFPSIINFTSTKKIICRENNKNSIRNIKRIIGRNSRDTNFLKLLPDINFKLKIEKNVIYVHNKYENKDYSLEELNSLILKKIYENAKSQTNSNIKDVIITVPAHFNQIQRESIITSAKIAGLNCLRLINEPTAAALAYGLNFQDDINILIFDLGGGTFDLSILNIDQEIYEVVSTLGDNNIGGEDFTKILINDAIQKFKKDNQYISLNKDDYKNSINKLRQECENLKCNYQNKNDFTIKNFYNNEKIKIDLYYKIDENKINELFQPLLEKIKKMLEKIMQLSCLNYDDINHIILVGGGSKLKIVNYLISSMFKKMPICNIDPDLVVSCGAAIQGYILSNPDSPFSKNLTLIDVLSLSIGIETNNGTMTKIIRKDSKIPIKKFKYFTNDEDNQSEVDIKIYQGERELVKDNFLIGNFKLKNLKLLPKGKNIIKVEMQIDSNGMITVNAYEKGRNNSNKIKIKNINKLYDEKEIQKMISDSEKYSELDKLKVRFIKLHNKLELQINNLNYNCNFNKFIDLDDEKITELKDYIIKISEKLKVITQPFNFLINKNISKEEIDKEDILNAIVNLKKLLKINDKKYSMLLVNYNNNENSKMSSKEEYTEFKSERLGYNSAITIYFLEIIESIRNNKEISNFTKDCIFNYYQNLNFKLQSLELDNELYEEYYNLFTNNIKQFIKDDVNLINNYGNVDNLQNFVISNNINDLKDINSQDLNSIEIYNLLYSLSKKYNLN